MAACKLRDVFCHATGASIQPRGLSIAMTARSSYKIGIGSQSGSSMQLGLAMRQRSSRCESAQTIRQRRKINSSLTPALSPRRRRIIRRLTETPATGFTGWSSAKQKTYYSFSFSRGRIALLAFTQRHIRVWVTTLFISSSLKCFLKQLLVP